MTEETNTDEAPAEVVEAQQEEIVPQVELTTDEINWRRANEVMKAQKAHADALAAEKIALQAEIARMRSVPQAPLVEEKDEFADLDPTDPITVEQARRLSSKQAEAVARQAVNQALQQFSLTKSEEDMRANNEDYDYVVDNFTLPLIKNDPVLAHLLRNDPNPAKKAYEVGLMSDAYKKQGTAQPTSKKAEKILKNAARPTSVHSVAPSLKDQASEVTNMSNQQIWELSQKYARQA